MTMSELDGDKIQAFGARMLGILNGGTLALMLSIGHRTGLLDRMAELRPSTSEEIATAAGLNERYVREWLAALTTGRIVEYDAATMRYWLPREHAAMLIRAAGPSNMASLTQFIAMLGDVESEVVEAFRNGGGVPYARFPRFQEVMAEESAAVFDATLIQSTLPLVPGLIRRLRAGIDVADVGCGSGHAIAIMARAFPNSRFTGFDFSVEGIAAARAEASAKSLANAAFEATDAATLTGPPRFDLITTFDSVHDQARPDRVLAAVAAMLRPGGTYLCVDVAASSNLEDNIGHPIGPMFYAMSTMHCMTVSLALGGMGLGAMWGEQKAHEMMHDAGFTQVETARIKGDVSNNYYIATKG